MRTVRSRLRSLVAGLAAMGAVVALGVSTATAASAPSVLLMKPGQCATYPTPSGGTGTVCLDKAPGSSRVSAMPLTSCPTGAICQTIPFSLADMGEVEGETNYVDAGHYAQTSANWSPTTYAESGFIPAPGYGNTGWACEQYGESDACDWYFSAYTGMTALMINLGPGPSITGTANFVWNAAGA